jgi:dihydroorotate dehydrogenase/NAD-dependent dihydropyrimidine dehydrogenase PreA subunit
MDLSTRVAGLELGNPLMPASGPLTGDDGKMLAVAGFGVGAMVTKTVSVLAAEVPRPCIWGGKDYLLNAELWSEFPLGEWADRILPGLRRSLGIPLVVSAGYSASDLETILPRLEPFADAFEISTHYVGNDVAAMAKTMERARAATKKPILFKMSPHIPSPEEFALAVRESGLDGIVVANSLGPALGVDGSRILLGNAAGQSWMSGPAIKPIALALVARVRKAVPDLALIGVGGIRTADDVVEFLLAGADAVQLLSSALLYGKDIYRRILDALPAAVERAGFSSVAEVVASRLAPFAVSKEIRLPLVDGGTCTGCGICEAVCPWFAVALSDRKPSDPPGPSGRVKRLARMEGSACFGCGLCESRCPAGAISGIFSQGKKG